MSALVHKAWQELFPPRRLTVRCPRDGQRFRVDADVCGPFLCPDCTDEAIHNRGRIKVGAGITLAGGWLQRPGCLARTRREEHYLRFQRRRADRTRSHSTKRPQNQSGTEVKPACRQTGSL